MDPIVKDPNDWSDVVVRPTEVASVAEEISPTPSPSVVAEPSPQPAPVIDPNDWSDVVVRSEKKTEEKTSLTYDDVIADPERMGKIRQMMSASKDIKYETAPAEETMDAFMSHMRWMNTNEASTAKELFSIIAADEETKAKYGEAYKVYDEMGSMFSNGDAWNGMLSYGGAIITSPSTWLGLGIGKVAGSISAKGASKAAQVMAIKAATNQIAAKSGGKVAKRIIANKLINTSSKAAAKYHIAGVLAAEIPLNTIGDYMYQQTQIKTGVQDEYSFLQGAIAAAAGGVGAIPAIGVLRSSSNSVLGNAEELITTATKERAKTASKRAAPAVKESMEKAQVEWKKLAENGKAFEDNIPLQDAILNWFMDVGDENSFARILQREGFDLQFGEGTFTRDLIGYAMNMGDESLEAYGKIFEPLGVTFGQATEALARTVERGGQVLNPASRAARFFNEINGAAVSQKNANKTLGEMSEEAAKNPLKGEVLDEKEVLRYASSTWKKNLVSTPMTTALNVKGWGLARAANTMGDLFLMGAHLGTAGIKALVDPTASMKHLAKAKSLAQNQVFALQTLVDPFLSHEAFLQMLEKAPTKIQKSASGQIFGGIEDFSPARFGLNPENKVVKAVEGYSNFAQKISFVHLQDSLTKGVTGMISLDKESRIAFGKGISGLVKDGETWKITDEMWERTMRRVLQETYSEDLSKGTGVIKDLARGVQNISNSGIGGFIIPFGKFLNFTVANTYRYSPLSIISVGKHISKEGVDETAEEMFARFAVGTSLWTYFVFSEKEKQAEGLQWFEHRKSDGSVENIQNTFPHSMYSLIGRVISNLHEGQGGSRELLTELVKQAGPLDTISDTLDFRWLKPMVDLLTDERIDSERDSAAKVVVDTLGEMAGKITAGYTRPFDPVNRVLGAVIPEAGGGSIADIKQAEGIDKAVLQATRYTSFFFNALLGEDDGEGNRLMGKPRQSALKYGNVKQPNPAGVLVGAKVDGAAKYINKVLGMVDKPPYLAESFTSGNAEYDAFVNKEITPILESYAERLFKNEVFQKMPRSQQMDMVDQMLSTAESDLLSILDGNLIGGENERLIAARRNLMTGPKPARIRAKKELGITTSDHKLSLFEIEQIRRYIGVESDVMEAIK